MVSQFGFSLSLLILFQFYIKITAHNSTSILYRKIRRNVNSVFLRIALHDRPLVGVNNVRSSIFPGNRFCNFCHGEK